MALAAGAALSAVVVGVGSGSPRVGTGSGSPGAHAPVLRAAEVRAFSGPLAPQEVFSVGGRLWLVGSTSLGTVPEHCAAEELDPSNLSGHQVAMPACPLYSAVGGMDLYFAVASHSDAADTDTFHIEALDTATGQATVFAPVVTVTSGTGYAHMTMAYGAGWLWLEPWSTEILQISPSSGAVVGRVSDVPPSNSGHPWLAVTGGAVWAAGGTSAVTRIVASSSEASPVFSSPTGTVLWVAVAGGRVWADEVRVADGGRGRPVSRLLAFSGSGERVADSPAPEIGDLPVLGSGGRMWAADVPCSGAERVWDLDPHTGAPLASTTLPPVGFAGCGPAGAPAATIGTDLYLLRPAGATTEGGELYRITVRPS